MCASRLTLAIYMELLKQELPKEELNRFFADWESFGLTRIEEWC